MTEPAHQRRAAPAVSPFRLSKGWIKHGFRWLAFFLAGVAGLLMLAAAGFWWWAGTEGSLDWTLRQIARVQPLSAEGVQGSLRDGLRAERLRWAQDGLTVQAFDVRVEWQPLALLRGQVKLDQAAAARIRVDDNRPPAPKIPPQSFAVPFRVQVDELKVDQIEWKTATNVIEATNLAAAYRFDGWLHKLQLEQLRWAGGSYSGEANLGAGGELPLDATLQGHFETSVPGSSTTVALDFTATLMGPVTDLQAEASLHTAPAASSASGTGTAIATASAAASARIAPWAAQPVPLAQAEFRKLDLGALWPQAPHTSLMGRLRAQPAGTGTWTLTTQFRNELAGPWDKERLPVEQLNATGEWRTAGQAIVRHLEGLVGGGQLQASGRWRGTDRWAMEGRLTNIDPSALYSDMASLPVSGRADLSGEGKAVSFDLDLNAQAPDNDTRPGRVPPTEMGVVLGALELRQARARGRWADGVLALPLLEVRTADATLQASLEIVPQTHAGSGHATLAAPGLKARADGKVAKDSGGGTLQVNAPNLALALAWLKRLPAMPAAIADLSASGRGDARVAWQGGWHDPTIQASASVPLMELKGSAAQPTGAARGWTVRDASVSVQGRLSNARVAAHARAELGPRRIAVELAGTGGRKSLAPAVWQGNLDTLMVSASDPAMGMGTWTLRLQRAFDMRWSARSFDAGAGAALLSAPALQANGRRTSAGPAVIAWEPVRWRSGELQTAGRLTGLPLAWLELIGGSQLAGSALSGDMVFDGEWNALLGPQFRVHASLARSGGDVSLLAHTPDGRSARVSAGVRQARLSLAARGEAMTVTLLWDSERGGTAQGRLVTRLARGGAAGWYWPDGAPLSGGVEARLPRIGVWSLLAPPGWRLRGSLVADLAISGTKANPQLDGTLVADDLALRSVVDGIALQGGHLRARLEGRRLVISEFVLHGAGQGDAGGTLRATGEGSWTGDGLQVRMAAQLTRLRASIRTDREVTVSGRLAARLDASGTTVTGDLRVDRARIVLPEERTPRLGDDVVVRGAGGHLTRREAKASDRAAKPEDRPLTVAVDLDLGNDFRVQGMGIDTRLRGSLVVSAESIAQPQLTGTIRAVGGEYRAYGQRLEIERGVIRFTGPIDNPALDILALRPNMLDRVGVMVTGRALAPYVRLYSEPDMPDVEKLSLLVTGRRAPSSGAEAALVQQAAMALLASRTKSGKGGIASALGLDELSFKRDGDDGPSITLGRRFGSNFYAAYERSLSGALGTLYIFYDLTRCLTLRLESGERTAIDVILTFSFG